MQCLNVLVTRNVPAKFLLPSLDFTDFQGSLNPAQQECPLQHKPDHLTLRPFEKLTSSWTLSSADRLGFDSWSSSPSLRSGLQIVSPANGISSVISTLSSTLFSRLMLLLHCCCHTTNPEALYCALMCNYCHFIAHNVPVCFLTTLQNRWGNYKWQGE